MVRCFRLLAATLVLATACGQARAVQTQAPPASTAPSPPSAQALAGSAVRTARAGSAHIALAMRMTVAPENQTLVAHASGVMSFRSRAAEMVTRTELPSGAYLTMREVTVWPVVYIRSPAFAALEKRGRPWVKMNMARIGRAQGINLNALAGAGNDDPSQMLSVLQGESDSIETVGHATVRGVGTTHYHAVIDLSKVAASASPALRAAVRRSEARLEAVLGAHTLPMDVWIGTDGRVRRLAYSVTVPLGVNGETMTMRLTLDMYGFGAPVRVTAPPAAQTTDITAAVAAHANDG